MDIIITPARDVADRTIDQHDLTRKEMKAVLMILAAREQTSVPLNEDIVDSICDFIYERPARANASCFTLPPVNPATIPPPFGRCPLINRLPNELRRVIFSESLPAKHTVIQPVCKEGRSSARPNWLYPRHNKTSDLLVLNRKLKDELTLCVYAERTFGIHVHEGITTGGIEFLDAGRQPLQYKDDNGCGDDRFERFSDRKEFGFHRLKKIEVTIFPATETCRHSALNTYYMNYALARMLDRSGESGEIVWLTINFASRPKGEAAKAPDSRRGIMRNEHWWWDSDLDAPSSTSIHNITDVELALRPFAILTHIHNVSINLPTKVKSHPDTVLFANALKSSMESRVLGGTLSSNDRLEYQADVMRAELFQYILSLKYGGKGEKIADLTDAEMVDENLATWEENAENGAKHERSMSGQKLDGGIAKWAKRSVVRQINQDEDDDESYEMQAAMLAQYERIKKGLSDLGQKSAFESIRPYAFDGGNRRNTSEDATEAESDRNTSGRQLGTITSSIPTLASLKSDLRKHRRQVDKLELKLDHDTEVESQPVDSAMSGVFPQHDFSTPHSGGGMQLDTQPVDTDMSGMFSQHDTLSAPHNGGKMQIDSAFSSLESSPDISGEQTFQGNGTMHLANAERRHTVRRRQQVQRLQQSEIHHPAAPLHPQHAPVEFSMQRAVPDVRRGFEEVIDLTGDEDGGADDAGSHDASADERANYQVASGSASYSQQHTEVDTTPRQMRIGGSLATITPQVGPGALPRPVVVWSETQQTNTINAGLGSFVPIKLPSAMPPSQENGVNETGDEEDESDDEL